MNFLLLYMIVAFSGNLSASPVHTGHIIFTNANECQLASQKIKDFKDRESRGAVIIDCMQVGGSTQ